MFKTYIIVSNCIIVLSVVTSLDMNFLSDRNLYDCVILSLLSIWDTFLTCLETEDRFGILRIECFEHFEYFKFLALGAFTSGLGLNAFESCFLRFEKRITLSEKKPPLPPRVNNCGHFTYYLLIVHVTKSELSTDHLPTFSCPLSYWMTPFHEILLSDAMSVTQSPIIIQTPEIEFVEDFLCKLDMKSHTMQLCIASRSTSRLVTPHVTI